MAGGVEIVVLSTQAPEKALGELVPQFEKATGHTVKALFTGTLDVKKRIAEDQAFDLLIMASPDIDAFITLGTLAKGSRVDLAKSGVGVAVKTGAPRPDIGTTETFKKALLSAKSIGYSTGPSGVYVVDLFERLGIAGELKPKLTQTPSGVFVGSLLAKGEVEFGIQQVSELSNFPGIDFVGPLPADIQKVTVFACGIAARSNQEAATQALVKFITTPAAAIAYKKSGMEPG
jgi:molybdate transport system substrate-binding protein